MDDPVFRALAEGYPAHKVWIVSLSDMWSEVERVLGHRVTFITDDGEIVAR